MASAVVGDRRVDKPFLLENAESVASLAFRLEERRLEGFEQGIFGPHVPTGKSATPTDKVTCASRFPKAREATSRQMRDATTSDPAKWVEGSITKKESSP